MGSFKKLEQLLKRLTEGIVPGCACTVMQKGEVIFEGNAGYADIAEGKPVTPSSVFRHASTTKLFTYAITMMLYEEGAFLLSDPLYEYLPEWRGTKKFITSPNGTVSVKPVKRPITIQDAMIMACGLPYCMKADEHTDQPTLREMGKAITPLLQKGVPLLRDEVRVMAEVPVMFDPGTRWQYGFGSEIIGALLEVVTGKPLRILFKERLIEPLGLRNTDTFFNGVIEKQLVKCYIRKEDRGFEAMPPEADAAQDPGLTPVGARPYLMSSISDFAVFMQMLASGGVYKGERFMGGGTVDLMRTNFLNNEQLKDFHNTYLAGYGYGLGVRVLMDKAAARHNGSVGAFGWTGGAGTWAEADPVKDLAIVYGHNMQPNDEEYVHLRIRAAAYASVVS